MADPRWTEETAHHAAHSILAGPGDHEWVEAMTEALGVLRVLADAGLLLPPGGETRPIGWIVLTQTHGRWQDDWDAEVHLSHEAGDAALAAAIADGQTAMLVSLQPAEGAPDA